MYQFENVCVCVQKCLLSAVANCCVPSLWKSCFCGLIAYFRPDLWAVSNLEAIWPIFCFFWLVVLVWVLEDVSFGFCFVVVAATGPRKQHKKQKTNRNKNTPQTLFLQGLGAFGGAKEKPKQK